MKNKRKEKQRNYSRRQHNKYFRFIAKQSVPPFTKMVKNKSYYYNYSLLYKFLDLYKDIWNIIPNKYHSILYEYEIISNNSI